MLDENHTLCELRYGAASVSGEQSLRTREAQLSQRGRAMLRVSQYFSKSLKVTRGQWK